MEGGFATNHGERGSGPDEASAQAATNDGERGSGPDEASAQTHSENASISAPSTSSSSANTSTSSSTPSFPSQSTANSSSSQTASEFNLTASQWPHSTESQVSAPTSPPLLPPPYSAQDPAQGSEFPSEVQLPPYPGPALGFPPLPSDPKYFDSHENQFWVDRFQPPPLPPPSYDSLSDTPVTNAPFRSGDDMLNGNRIGNVGLQGNGRNDPLPDSHISLSLFACICCNGLCLGTAAFFFSLASIFALPRLSGRGASNDPTTLNEQRLQLSASRGKWAWRLSLISILVNIIFFIVYTVLQGLGDNNVLWPPLPFKRRHDYGDAMEGSGSGDLQGLGGN